MDVLAKRLREARLRYGISQENLGVMAGIDEMSASARMNQYERGKHTPDYAIVNKIAKVLGIPCAFFYAEDDELAKLILHFGRIKKEDRLKFMEIVESFVE